MFWRQKNLPPKSPVSKYSNKISRLKSHVFGDILAPKHVTLGAAMVLEATHVDEKGQLTF
jgi:hypothetical protein